MLLILQHGQIVDIIKYCINPKSSFKPVGMDIIIQLMKESCIPLSVITNNKVRDEILQLHENTHQVQTGGSTPLRLTSPPPGISQKTFKNKYLKPKSQTYHQDHKLKFKWQTL